MGISGTYYFRIIPVSFDQKIIRQILELGHEVGYHYEDVDLVNSWRNKFLIKNYNLENESLINLAYQSFCRNLQIFRKNFEIKTIYMHGSPRAKYNNTILWGKYNYKDLGIIGDAQFDLDWSEFGYITDTGRKWNAGDENIRDRVSSKINFNFKATFDIIDNVDKLVNQMMISVHPQRWSDKSFPWFKELIGQNMKNVIKKFIYSRLNS